MASLTDRWPLGLSRRTWPLYALGLAILLGLALALDGDASKSAVGWPEGVRGFFFAITDYGLSDWILIPSLAGALLAGVTRLLARSRLVRRIAEECALLSGFVFLGVGVPGLLANLIKRAVGRARPELFDALGSMNFQSILNDYTHQSFPSGHATTAIAFAFVLGFLWPRSFPWLLALGLAVAVSRVPVGMHYPSDVIGGVVVGALGAYGVRNVFASRGLLFRSEPGGSVIRRPSLGARLVRRTHGRL